MGSSARRSGRMTVLTLAFIERLDLAFVNEREVSKRFRPPLMPSLPQLRNARNPDQVALFRPFYKLMQCQRHESVVPARTGLFGSRTKPAQATSLESESPPRSRCTMPNHSTLAIRTVRPSIAFSSKVSARRLCHRSNNLRQRVFLPVRTVLPSIAFSSEVSARRPIFALLVSPVRAMNVVSGRHHGRLLVHIV
jgi:hypothetical protein